MSDEQLELEALGVRRRSLIVDLFCGLVAGVALAAAWPRDAATPDAHFLVALVVVAFSLTVVRVIANTAALLEHPCPRCFEPYFGGLEHAFQVLPVPARECDHCGLPLPR